MKAAHDDVLFDAAEIAVLPQIAASVSTFVVS